MFGGASVGSFAVSIKTSFVTDADAVLVVVKAMGSYHGLGTTSFDGAISADDVMVADTLPSSLLVPLVDLSCAGGLVGSDGGTVDD